MPNKTLPIQLKVAQARLPCGELLKNRFCQWWELDLEDQVHPLSLHSSISATSSKTVCPSEPGGPAYSSECR